MATKTLDSGQEKVEMLCNALIEEALEPAKKQAESIIAQAEEQARKKLQEAEEQAKVFMEEALAKIETERALFHTSIKQAAKLSVQELRQAIEERIFSHELQSAVNSQSSKPDVIAKILHALIQNLEKEGIRANLSAVIPKSVKPDEVNALLKDELVKHLREKGVKIGHFHGGAQVVLNDQRITVDVTDETLKELITGYIKESFREYFFPKDK